MEKEPPSQIVVETLIHLVKPEAVGVMSALASVICTLPATAKQLDSVALVMLWW